jgi:hypothetical protein
MSHHQNTVQNGNKKAASKSFENVVKFSYLGMTVTNQNYVQEEIKSRLSFGDASYNSVRNFNLSVLHLRT